MSPDTVPYPPGPDPEHLSLRDLRSPSGARLQQTLLTLALLGFLVAYLGVIAASLLLAGLLATLIPEGSTLVRIASLMGIVACIAVFAKFLRWLLRVKPLPDASPSLAITAEDQPGLFAFLQRVADDAGCAMPRRVLLTPDANAAMIPTVSWKNLFAAPPNDLALGLGLVNALNLSELQAVLAHEFGHVAKSPWLRGVEIAIGRLVAEVSFLGILASALHAARKHLVREREFLADRIAATVAGTPATLAALAKAETASDTFARAVEEAEQAADRGLFTNDLYFHQHAATPSEGTAREAFSHPLREEREERLRDRFIESAIDTRTPWILVNDAAGLRRRLTGELLRTWPGTPKHVAMTDARAIQTLLDRERSVPSLHQAYDNRRLALTLRDWKELLAMLAGDPWPDDRLRRVAEQLHEEIPRRIARRNRLVAQRKHLLERLDDVNALDDLDDRIAQADEWFHGYDRRVALVHLRMAEDTAPLDQCYREHLALQSLVFEDSDKLRAFDRIARGNASFFRDYVTALRHAHRKLTDAVTADPDLLEEPLIDELAPGPLRRRWIADLRSQCRRVEIRLRKKDRESLERLLKLQDTIRNAWQTRTDLLRHIDESAPITIEV